MHHDSPKQVNLADSNSLIQVNAHPPAVTHWPRENRRIVMLHYDHLPPDTLPEYQPQGHHVLSFFNLSGAGLNTPVDREDWLDGRRVTLPLQVPGTAFLCPDRVSHAAVWRDPLEATSFCLTDEFIDHVSYSAFDGVRPDLVPRFGLYDDGLYHLAIVLKEALSDPQTDSLGQLYQDQVMVAMAMYLIQNHGTRPLTPELAHPLDNRRFSCLLDYVEAQLSTNIALEPLADALNIGEFQLCQGFLSRTGLSLYQFVHQRRQQRARLLLKVARLPQEEVAQRCGFGDCQTMINHLYGPAPE